MTLPPLSELDRSLFDGRFIVIDGPDGAGKSTLVKLLAEQLNQAGHDCVPCRDPGGTSIGDQIRSIVLSDALNEMCVESETLLFMASRAQLINSVVNPALKRNALVICDRFVSATCAYQCAAGADFDEIITLARYAVRDTWPALTVILDVPVTLGRERRIQRNARQAAPGTATSADTDAMEQRSRDFHQQVRDNFLLLADRYPAPVVMVDGSQPLEIVYASAVSAITEALRSQVSVS